MFDLDDFRRWNGYVAAHQEGKKIEKEFQEKLKLAVEAKRKEEISTLIIDECKRFWEDHAEKTSRYKQSPKPVSFIDDYINIKEHLQKQEKNMQINFNTGISRVCNMTLETTNQEIIKIFKDAIEKGGVDAVSKMLKEKVKFKIEKLGFYRTSNDKICHVHHIHQDENDDDCCAVDYTYRDAGGDIVFDACTRFGKETDNDADIIEFVKECDIYDPAFLETLK